MENIDAELARGDAANLVFYEDEVDIDLNPKLGPTECSERSKAGCHTTTECQNYLAGVLHVGNGRVLYVSEIKKTHPCLLPCLKTASSLPTH